MWYTYKTLDLTLVQDYYFLSPANLVSCRGARQGDDHLNPQTADDIESRDPLPVKVYRYRVWLV